MLLFLGDGEEEEDDELEAESSDEDGEDMSMNEEPGNDSGCTAVVALLRGELQSCTLHLVLAKTSSITS